MRWSSLVQQELGQRWLLLPQQQQPPTVASHCCSRRHFDQRCSSLTSRKQQAPVVGSESLGGIAFSSFSRSACHGGVVVLDNQKLWYDKKKRMKQLAKLYPFRRTSAVVHVQSSNKPFEQSYRPRGNFPGLGSQSTRVLEAPTGLARADRSPEEKQVLVVKEGGGPDQLHSNFSVYGQSYVQENSTDMISERLRRTKNLAQLPLHSNQALNSQVQVKSTVETRHVIGDQAVLRSSEVGVNQTLSIYQTSNSSSHGKLGSRVEPSYMIDEHTRNCQNGAHPPLSNFRSGSSISKTRYSGRVFSPVLPGSLRAPSLNQRRVQQDVDASHGRIQKGTAESQVRREDRPSEALAGGRAHDYKSLGATEAVRQAQLESSLPQTQTAAERWREATRKLKQDQRPAYAGGGFEAAHGSLDGLSIESEPVSKSENALLELKEGAVLKVQELEQKPEPGVQFRESSDGWRNTNSGGQGLAAGEPVQLLATDLVEDESEAGIQSDGEPKRTNDKVLVVNNVSLAQAVVEKLRGKFKDFIHACDTEVADIDVKKESPVGHGHIVCFSIYCGPNADFGGGKCRLWVDVLENPAVLDAFRSYFEDPNVRKVWHNYSFDRHILANNGIMARGFYADTMHLARLYDSARTGAQGGYSLEGLTSDKYVMDGHWDLIPEEELEGKLSMKQLFGQANIKKNGEEGKLRVVPPVKELQTQSQWREKWIHYSSFDTVCTWCLWKSLQDKLTRTDWMLEGKIKQKGKSMYDFYLEYIQPFGDLLVQMEAEGMMLDREHLANIEKIAIKQQEFSANRFKAWAAKRCPDAVHMNVGSDAQIRQLLFGGKENKNDSNKKLEMERVFNAPNIEGCVEEGRKSPKKTRPFTLRGLGVDIPVDSYTSAGWPAVGGPALKILAGKVSIDYTMLDEIEPVKDPALVVEDSAVLTSTGVKGGSQEDLSVYGKAYKAFGGGKEGKEACMAFAALCELASINTLISNFIQPLQGSDIKGPEGRVHCSLNLNTETGRLSARRPSLQNQPALEKDRYKIRQAFVASPGNSLIVADYGQLELRILAHLTDCKSMLKAFVDGGDFHSRTAMNMYPHVRTAIQNGEVILEWHMKPGEEKPPVPLLKDVFGAERRKAKMLNFSIAYGKTAMGLCKDWKVSVDEAKATVNLWYSDRQEVLRWQQERIKEANDTNQVYTLLGRTRHFPDVESSNRLVRGHIERAAINTPVQGSAADVAMCAMLEINCNRRLKELGWKLLLQVHDEVILEGPAESADEAKDLVTHCMSFPFRGKNPLRVALAVDAKHAQSWYAAK